MSYLKKGIYPDFPGQYVEVGDADPWDTSSTPATTTSTSSTDIFGSFKNLFGSAAGATQTVAAPASTPAAPSTITKAGSGVAAFLNALAKPTPIMGAMPGAYPPGYVPRPGMGTGTKLALAGGAALLLVVLATR